LVYADWLDERGDPTASAKAQFLRTQNELSRLPPEDTLGALLRERMRLLAELVKPVWRAIVSQAVIEKCKVRFEYECPRTWDNLRATDDARVRFCNECRRQVYYCETVAQARVLGLRGECVAVDCRVDRRPDDLDERHMLMGRIA